MQATARRDNPSPSGSAGFDKIATPHSVSMSLAARIALGNVSMADINRADAAPWREAAAMLKADPMAAIDVELPDAVIPPLPGPVAVLSRWPPVRHEPIKPLGAGDDGDPHHLADATDGAA
jgi:hypothetical protein